MAGTGSILVGKCIGLTVLIFTSGLAL